MSKFILKNAMRNPATLMLTGIVLACGGEKGEQKVMTVAQVDPAPVTTQPETKTDTKPVTPEAVTEPKYTNVKYGDAETVFRKGSYKDAAEMFGSFVIEHPESPAGQYMLGLSAWKSGDHKRAEEALKRAVELDSTSVKAQINLARVLLEQGRNDEALPYIKKVVELKPESGESWRVLGNVNANLGRPDDAIESYHQALVRNDQDSWSMNNYGLVLINLGRSEEALMPLARAVQLKPKSAMFQNNFGIALEQTGYLGSAIDAYTAAVDADSTYTKAKVNLERVQKLLGETDGEFIDREALVRSFVEEIVKWQKHDR
jgi:predicted Zn-dependent protease